MHNLQKSAGFTMLEVMISIVIIAFGLLGIAGLQAFALKNSQSASARLTATVLAEDMVDRLRSNQPAMASAEYNKPNTADYDSNIDCATNPCLASAPANMADYDRALWADRVRAALPGGVGIVCIDSTPNDGLTPAAHGCDGLGEVMYAVKIWWRDDRSERAAEANPQRFVTAFHP